MVAVKAPDSAAAPRASKQIKQLEVMITDVIPETHDTTTLVLFTGNESLDYRAGHFLTIDPHQFAALERFTAFLEDTKGKREPPRAYSLASAPDERYLAITVKEERYVSTKTKYPPLLSPLLVRRAMRGMRLEITGFTGPYTLPADVESTTDHLVHISAGSGVVPNFSILKHALNHHPKLRQTFICANKTRADIIYRDALDEIARLHPERFRVVHTLTRDLQAGSPFRRGRIDRALLKELIPDRSSCLAFVCGPGITPLEKKEARLKGEEPAPRFLEAVLTDLEAIGFSKKRIRHESYG
jgi:3-ketosteroid 9alpha-monooxygenase subunit B